MNMSTCRVVGRGGWACLVYTALLCMIAAASLARAQSAPEGNSHPRTQSLSGSGASLANPFGQHNTDLAKVPKTANKAMLAATVDLEPLRELAVFHNGRVKVLGTLAKESVKRITGRNRYVDYIKTPTPGGEDVREVAFDPLFTLLDMTIDPGYYLDKPLIGVEFLPLREDILLAEFPDDESMQERWKKVARVSPLMVDRHARKIGEQRMSSEAFTRALNSVDDAVRLFMQGKANMVLVAPGDRSVEWIHLSSLSESSPARQAAMELGAAWRENDAQRVNAAARRLADELPKINSSMYPQATRRLEVTYNKVNAFEWGFWMYFLSLVSLLLAFGTGRRWLSITGAVFLGLALLLHGFGFVSRCIIAERFAIQNQFESMTGLSLFAVIVGTVVMLLMRQWLFGAAAAAVGFLVLVTATQTGIPGAFIEREAAILNTSVLLKYHVTTVLVSYGLISLGFIISLFYLGAHYFGSGATGAVADGPPGAVSGVAVALGGSEDTPRAKLLADLDTAQLTVLQLAFWTLGVGILLGGWWADHSWGRWWAFDPKETWALITWIVYLIVVHVRVANPAKKGITTAWLSIVGFFVMLWTYFGVNLLLPGLHAYA